eukprot:8395381-Ditylum_brightwellii.AAC.1
MAVEIAVDVRCEGGLAFGGGVGFCVSACLVGDVVVDIAGCVKAWVWVTTSHEGLCHRINGLSCAFPAICVLKGLKIPVQHACMKAQRMMHWWKGGRHMRK